MLILFTMWGDGRCGRPIDAWNPGFLFFGFSITSRSSLIFNFACTAKSESGNENGKRGGTGCGRSASGLASPRNRAMRS